jgi:hypothetical protein
VARAVESSSPGREVRRANTSSGSYWHDVLPANTHPWASYERMHRAMRS